MGFWIGLAIAAMMLALLALCIVAAMRDAVRESRMLGRWRLRSSAGARWSKGAPQA
jgi:hypothetical protein